MFGFEDIVVSGGSSSLSSVGEESTCSFSGAGAYSYRNELSLATLVLLLLSKLLRLTSELVRRLSVGEDVVAW